MFNEITRRRFTSWMLACGFSSRWLMAIAEGQRGTSGQRAFVHPGLLHSSGDLGRMRTAVAAKEEPIFSGFVKLRDHPQSQPSYIPAGASVEIGRNPNVRFGEFDRDCNAAYQCALMGSITGEQVFWKISVGILDDWAATLKRVSGADAVLCASLGGFKLINAAELARWGGAPWPAASVERFSALLRDTFVPVLQGFAPFANGNWDTAAMKTLLAAAVFLEDARLFERVLVYYHQGCGDGRLTNYIYASGQCQESGRDQQHTQLGLAHLGDCCEIAWHQGLDLYGTAQDRLLTGFEYTARYELGDEVPFLPDVDRTGKYRHKVISARSALRPVYEQIFHHYVHRRGLDAPWTTKAAAAVRPEGEGFQADHTGFGTLLYSRTGPDSSREPARRVAGAGLHVSNEGHGLRVSWVPAVAGDSIHLMRIGPGAGRRVFRPAAGEASFLDHEVKPGEKYAYHLEVKHGVPLAEPTFAIAGLPREWIAIPRGAPGAFTDGSTWTLTGAGADLSHLCAVVAPARRSQSFVVRLLPEFASARLHAGIVIASSAKGVLATLLLEPSGTSPAERVDWTVRLRLSGPPSGPLEIGSERPVGRFLVSYGRMAAPLWLRASWEGKLLRAESSGDGIEWELVGSGTLRQEADFAGLAMTSGIEDVEATVRVDHVASRVGTQGA